MPGDIFNFQWSVSLLHLVEETWDPGVATCPNRMLSAQRAGSAKVEKLQRHDQVQV